MASPHERKIFIPQAIYHAYSRGVNKAVIFHSPEDYIYFTECMMLYLIPKEQLIGYLSHQGYPARKILHLSSKARSLKNYSDEISLIAYCLMPNHFHVLLEQKNESGMTNFIKSLLIRYSMYYSRKYTHVGPVFQGRYKATHVANEAYFSIVVAYIHENPTSLREFHSNPKTYPWSSIRDYSNNESTRFWIKKTRSF